MEQITSREWEAKLFPEPCRICVQFCTMLQAYNCGHFKTIFTGFSIFGKILFKKNQNATCRFNSKLNKTIKKIWKNSAKIIIKITAICFHSVFKTVHSVFKKVQKVRLDQSFATRDPQKVIRESKLNQTFSWIYFSKILLLIYSFYF